MMLVTFHSVSGALLLERMLKRQGVAGSVIPVPRELSTSCGYAVEADAGDAELISLMEREEIEWSEVYSHEKAYRLVQENVR